MRRTLAKRGVRRAGRARIGVITRLCPARFAGSRRALLGAINGVACQGELRVSHPKGRGRAAIEGAWLTRAGGLSISEVLRLFRPSLRTESSCAQGSLQQPPAAEDHADHVVPFDCHRLLGSRPRVLGVGRHVGGWLLTLAQRGGVCGGGW